MLISSQAFIPKPKIKTLVLAVFQNQEIHQHPWCKNLPANLQQTLKAYAKVKEFQGKIQESKILPYGKNGEIIILIGKGEKKDWNPRLARLLIRRLVVLSKQHHIQELGLVHEDFELEHLSTEGQFELLVENLNLAAYEYNQYKSVPPGGWSKLKKVIFFSLHSDLVKIKTGIKTGEIIAEAVNHARDLANTPGSDMTPKSLAEAATKLAKAHGFSCKVLHQAEIKKLKMGGILGVAKGSDLPPTFSVLEYAPGQHKKDRPLVFIGKGITFDSGGLNVKPDTSMYEMHMDMSGAAAVLGAMSAIAQLKLPIHVIGLVPAAENMSAGSAYRPGDQLKSLSGKTIEIKHTDAEGRVILADVLTYSERLKPAAVIDVATLTGAAMAALGQRAAAILSPDEKLSFQIQELAEASGDYAWPLPLWPEYESEVKGTFGDVSNISITRYGGAITGAAFLWQFAKKLKRWAHIDIAPTMTSLDDQNLAKGSTGAGTRLLIAIARKLKL